MPGASQSTRRIKTISANWIAGPDGDDGRFEVSLITEDGQRHVLAPSPLSTMTLVALSQADATLLWDPEGSTLIAADVVGRMPWSAEPESTEPVE